MREDFQTMGRTIEYKSIKTDEQGGIKFDQKNNKSSKRYIRYSSNPIKVATSETGLLFETTLLAGKLSSG